MGAGVVSHAVRSLMAGMVMKRVEMTVCCSFVGDPCGKHGPYTFYKAFRYRKEDGARSRIFSLGGFFLLQVGSNNQNVCIGELQLLWDDRNNNTALSSSRLYFLPENTPQGRAQSHGQDEVIAMSEKVVLRLDDLVGWMAQDVPWNTGCPASISDNHNHQQQQHNNDDDCDDDDDEEEDGALQDGGAHDDQNGGGVDHQDGDEDDASGAEDSDVVVVSYPRYCRYKAMLKRLEGTRTKRKWLRSALVAALGGSSPVNLPTVRILFCRDTFHFDALEKHELLCNHLAPNLKGRPRKKRSKDAGSESNESTESRDANTSFKEKGPALSNGCRKDVAGEDLDEQRFLQSLFKYMRRRNTPIERVPHLGFKQINLYVFFTCTQKMGGYEKVTAKKLWKQIYDELGGNPGSTSAATCTRRHYERLLLPYERNLKGEEDKPLPPVPSRPHKLSTSGTSPVTVSSGGAGSSVAKTTSRSDGDVSVVAAASSQEDEEDSSLSPDPGGPRTGSVDSEDSEGDAEDEDEDKSGARRESSGQPVDGVGGGQPGGHPARTLKSKDDAKQRQWEEFRRKSIAERESARQSVTRATKENHPKPTLVVPPLEVAPALLQLHQATFKPLPNSPSSEPSVAKRAKVEDAEVPRPAQLHRAAQPAPEAKPKAGSDPSSARPSVIRHTHSALLGQPSSWCHVAPPGPRALAAPLTVAVAAHLAAKTEATCPVRTVAPFHQSPFTFGWSLARERAPLATRDANCRDHRHHGQPFREGEDEELPSEDDERREEEEDCGGFVALDLRVKKPHDAAVPNSVTWSSGPESPKELDLSVKRPAAVPPAVEILPVPKCPRGSRSPCSSPQRGAPPPPPPPTYDQYSEPTGKAPRFPEYGAALLAPPPYYALPVPRSFLGLAGYAPDRPNPGPGGTLRDSFPYPGQFYSPYRKDGLPYGCPPEWRP